MIMLIVGVGFVLIAAAVFSLVMWAVRKENEIIRNGVEANGAVIE